MLRDARAPPTSALARSSAPEVAEYARKVADRDHWLAGMCRLQARMS
jgi:hypothetical protein